MDSAMRGRKLIAFTGAILVCLGSYASAQQTVTDQYGTEILIDALPPDQQAQCLETQMSLESYCAGTAWSTLTGQFFLTCMASGGLSEEILVDYPRGVMFPVSDVRAEGWPGIEGFRTISRISEKVEVHAHPSIGTPVSPQLGPDNQTSRPILLQDGPVVDVLPPEDITSGGSAGGDRGGTLRIRVEGVDASLRGPPFRGRQMTTASGEPIRPTTFSAT
ncbi:MAG: hypothetical protein H7A53_00830 [Akkermansiaceae bacterium]|nr:hypothetical protein [Akkermansiaceae bacterium]